MHSIFYDCYHNIIYTLAINLSDNYGQNENKNYWYWELYS